MATRPTDWTLHPHASFPRGLPVLVCILDGYGENAVLDEYNAVFSAATPSVDALRSEGTASGRWRTVRAHGPAVGLPTWDDMGNSEVGHNALGCGQLIAQGASLVDKALADGSLVAGDGWKYVSQAFAEHTLHLIGLLSSGGVHSRANQLFALLRDAQKSGAKRVRVHILLDGRDVPDGSSVADTAELESVLAELRTGGVDARVASGGGRMHITMDRYEADWAMVQRGWAAHVLGTAEHTFTDPVEGVKALRKGMSTPNDQYLPSFVVVDDKGQPVGKIQDGDAVVLFNFRADRMVELSKAFEYGAEFTHFDRGVALKDIKFAGLMMYDGDLKLPSHYLVAPPAIHGVSGEYLSKNGLKTFACSETQKFGHVTFFWNGNRSGYFDEKLETYLEIPSDNVPFNTTPAMKAPEITAAGIAALRSKKYDVVRVNFANPDMVGHTGDLAAARKACEVVDAQVAALIEEVTALGGVYLLTADHGNADDMVQREKKTNKPVKNADGSLAALTSHTLAPVPVCVGGPGLLAGAKFRSDLPHAGLANITATYLNLMGFAAPESYEPSLLEVV